MRVSITVKRDWPKGSWNILRTNLKRNVPRDILEEAKWRILDRAISYAPSGPTGRLAATMDARIEGDRIVITSKADYAEAIEKGFKEHWIPLEWWGQKNSEKSFITDPVGFAKVGPYTGARFIGRAVDDLRPMMKEIGVNAVKKAAKEASLPYVR